MPKKLKNIILAITCLVSSWSFSQAYPLQVSAQMIPPYSLKLSDYTTAMNERIVATLLLTDVREQNMQIGIRLYIENGRNIAIQSSPAIQGATPLYISGGIPLRLSNLDLRPYFQLENLHGISPQQYNQPLPDGLYQFCFEVYEWTSGEALSRKSCATAYLVLNDPPILNFPNKGELIAHKDPQNIIFQWTPRHLNATNVQYEFTLTELWDVHMDPQAAFLASRPLYQTTTRANTLLYGPGETALLPDKTYAWRVKALVSDGISETSVFKNGGYSEIFHFTHTGNCDEPAFILAKADSPTSEKIMWQGLGHLKYKIQFRKKVYPSDSPKGGGTKEGRWHEINSINEYVTLYNLEGGSTYEFRVGGQCNENAGYTYSQIYEFTTAIPNQALSYNCGITPEIEITNRELLQSLAVNDVFTAGDFPVTVKRITGTPPLGEPEGEGFTGWGYIVVPYLQDTKVRVSFNNIKINTDYQFIEGIIETDYDPTWGGMDDIGDEIEAAAQIPQAVIDLANAIDEELDQLVESIKQGVELNQNTNNFIDLMTETLADPNNGLTDEQEQNLQEFISDKNNVKEAIKKAQEEIADGKHDEFIKQNLVSNLVGPENLETEQISDVAESSFDFEIHQSMEGMYKEEKLSLDVLPTDLSRQIFDYEGILSSEFENFLAGLNPGGKYKVKVYTYNSQSEILKAIESIFPKNDEIIVFIQKRNDKALIKLSLGAHVNADLLQNNITKDEIVSILNEASPQSLKTSILFDEIGRNVNSYALFQEAEAYDGNIMALLAIKLLDWGVQGLESFKLEERYWNSNLSGYNPIFSNNQLENAFICGLYNGLINEAKAIPELASLLIKVSTSEENQKRMKEDINKLLEAGILNTLVEGFAKKYSGEPDAIVSYNVGKDVVFVATFFVSFTTVTKAGKITSIVKLVNPLEEALNLMKMVSRAGLSVTRTGQHVIIHIGNNVSRFIAKMDANNIFREIRWIENGNTLEILENIKYIDDTGGEAFGNLAIVKEGDDVGIKVQHVTELVGKYDWGLVKRYFQHIQEVTGRAIGQKQIDKLKDALRAKEYKKLTSEEYKLHQKNYNSSRREKMIKEWEENTGQKWPVDENDRRYQLHHIIEQQYGGPNEWWNSHPAKFPDEHQGGIHAAGSPSRELFN